METKSKKKKKSIVISEKEKQKLDFLNDFLKNFNPELSRELITDYATSYILFTKEKQKTLPKSEWLVLESCLCFNAQLLKLFIALDEWI